MGKGRVVMNPKILSGKPIIDGTRIPVYMILQLLENGYDSKRIISECYPELTQNDIQAAIDFAVKITKREPFVIKPACVRKKVRFSKNVIKIDFWNEERGKSRR